MKRLALSVTLIASVAAPLLAHHSASTPSGVALADTYQVCVYTHTRPERYLCVDYPKL